jgi:hypothetical protein
MGIVLAFANWNAQPDRARAWIAAVVMFLVMAAVRYGWQRAYRRSSKDVVKAALAKTVATVNNGVVLGALMMIIPLAMRLAHAYGLVDHPTSVNRALTIISGAYLVVIGNAMPRALPPLSSKPGLDARLQAFHRRAGWIWVLCGLAFVTASLALPSNAAGPVLMALVGAAVIVTVLQFVHVVRAAGCTLRA